MIYGVLENDKQGRVGDVKTKSHFKEIVRYLVSPQNDENGNLTNKDERVAFIENNFSLEQTCNPDNPEDIKQFKHSVVESYESFMEEIRGGKKPPKTLFKHSILSLSEEEVEAISEHLKNKYPKKTDEQIKEGVVDFLRMLSTEALESHMGLDRQYLLVVHAEKKHLHCHILSNTVSHTNKVFSKRREDLHNQEFCQRMADKYDFLANLNYKKVSDYELSESEKINLKQDIEIEREANRQKFIQECEALGINGKAVIGALIKSLDKFKDNEVVKPEHIIKAFNEINEKNDFDIQPVYNIKKSKINGCSFKIHSGDNVVSLKSSLLPEEYQFKHYKKNLVDYRQHQKEFDSIASWLSINQKNSFQADVDLIDVNNKEQIEELYNLKNFKSRYLTFDENLNALIFKNGWGNLKDKPVIRVDQADAPSKVKVSEVNIITVRESVALAKKMNFKVLGIDASTPEIARLFAIEAQKQGMDYVIQAHEDKVDLKEVAKEAAKQKLKEKPKTYQVKQGTKYSCRPSSKPKAANKSRHAPKLTPYSNNMTKEYKKKNKKDDDKDK